MNCIYKSNDVLISILIYLDLIFGPHIFAFLWLALDL